MRSEKEVQARRAIFQEALAATYGRDQPFNEERIKARIEEDEWFLGGGMSPDFEHTMLETCCPKCAAELYYFNARPSDIMCLNPDCDYSEKANQGRKK